MMVVILVWVQPPLREFRTMADAHGVDVAATLVGAIGCIVRDQLPTV
jgi:hypothetical protein